MFSASHDEERAAFGDLVGGQRRRAFGNLGEHHADLRAHRRPVGDRGAHVVEHALDVGGERVHRSRVRHAVDLDMDERFARRAIGVAGSKTFQHAARIADDRDDGVHDQVQPEAMAVDLHRHRIDQERHVVVDDLDHRVRRLPAMLGDGGIEHPHLGVPGVALVRELPLRDRRAVKVGRRAIGEVLGVRLAEIALDERGQLVALAAGGLAADEVQDFIELG